MNKRISKMLGYVRNPAKIPAHIKKAYESHPQKQALDYTITSAYIDNVSYYPFEKVLNKAIDKKPLGFSDKRKLKKLLEKLQKGKGLTKQTKKSFDKELPQIFERAYNGQITTEDMKSLKALKDWLDWNKQREKFKILEERKVIG